MTPYTADYTQHANGQWTGTLRANDTPGTTIETRAHPTLLDAAFEAIELAGPDAEVFLGDVRVVLFQYERYEV